MINKKIKLANILLKNKVTVSPMCQYSAKDGCPTSWHYAHLGSLATSGASMLTIESTAVNMNGRITLKDLCLSNKKQFLSFKKLIKYIKEISNIPICIQLSHAGRKGSSHIPWEKPNSPLKKHENSWSTFSSSEIPKDKGWPKPKRLNLNQIKKIIIDFYKSAKLAKKLGVDGIEIHMAHGYLLHQFLSPICNDRKDEFGGSFKNRIKFPIQILKKIKKVWPKNKILGARITATDHLDNGIDVEETIQFLKIIEKELNFICISSGGILSKTKLNPNKKAFRLKLAQKIKNHIKIPISVTGNMNDLKILNNAFKKKNIELVAIGRPFLKNPRWLLNYLNKKEIPNQFLRGF